MAKKKQPSSEQVSAAEITATPVGQTSRRIRRNTRAKRVLPRSTRGYVAWRHGPAMFKLLKVPQLALLDVAEQRGLGIREVYDLKYVRASMEEGSSLVNIYPTDENDLDRIEVVQNRSGFWVNLITLLDDTGWLLPPGYREKHPVVVVGPEGPDGPAVCVDLARVLERKGPGAEKKDEEKEAQDKKAQTPKQASETEKQENGTQEQGTQQELQGKQAPEPEAQAEQQTAQPAPQQESEPEAGTEKTK